MTASLWYYLRGYVIVEVSGSGSAKFINFMIHHNVPMWDIVKQDERLYFKLFQKDFKQIRSYIRKSHCKAKITKKVGLPFIMNRYRKRKILATGIGIFILILWGLSSFVWLVDVEGAIRLEPDDIVEKLEAAGYSEGKLKSNMNLRDAEAYLIREYPDIVWTGISYEGTRMVVSIAESVPKPIMDSKDDSPKTIVAKKDALITYIAVSKGKPLVRIGDVVSKGEPLVSGQMPLGEEDESLYYTSSKAQIKGKTTYVISDKVSLTQEKKQYLDSSAEKRTLKILGMSIPLYRDKSYSGEFDVKSETHQMSITKDFPLPFSMKVETIMPYTKTYYKLTKEEAKDKLYKQLWDKASEKLGVDYKILNKEIFYSEDGESINGTLEIIVEEDIGYALDISKVEDLTIEGE